MGDGGEEEADLWAEGNVRAVVELLRLRIVVELFGGIEEEVGSEVGRRWGDGGGGLVDGSDREMVARSG